MAVRAPHPPLPGGALHTARPSTADGKGFVFPGLRLATRPPSSDAKKMEYLQELASLKATLDKQLDTVVRAMQNVQGVAAQPLPLPDTPKMTCHSPTPPEVPLAGANPAPAIPQPDHLSTAGIPVAETVSPASSSSISIPDPPGPHALPLHGLRALLARAPQQPDAKLSALHRLAQPHPAAPSADLPAAGNSPPVLLDDPPPASHPEAVPHTQVEAGAPGSREKAMGEMPSLALLLAVGRQASYASDRVFTGLLRVERMVEGSVVRRNASWGSAPQAQEGDARRVMRYDQLSVLWSQGGVSHIRLRQLLTACKQDPARRYCCTEALVSIVGDGLARQHPDPAGLAKSLAPARQSTPLGSVRFRKGLYLRVSANQPSEQFALLPEQAPPFPPGYTMTRYTRNPPPPPHPMASAPERPLALLSVQPEARVTFLKMPKGKQQPAKRRGKRKGQRLMSPDVPPTTSDVPRLPAL